MTPEQATALIVAFTGLIGACGLAVQQFRSLRRDINGRMQQLLEAYGAAQRKDGELAGRDFASTSTPVSVMGGAGTPVPLVAIEPNENGSIAAPVQTDPRRARD